MARDFIGWVWPDEWFTSVGRSSFTGNPYFLLLQETDFHLLWNEAAIIALQLYHNESGRTLYNLVISLCNFVLFSKLQLLSIMYCQHETDSRSSSYFKSLLGFSFNYLVEARHRSAWSRTTDLEIDLWISHKTSFVYLTVAKEMRILSFPAAGPSRARPPLLRHHLALQGESWSQSIWFSLDPRIVCQSKYLSTCPFN